MKRSSVDLPLHRGRCPKWLYIRMKKLASLIVNYIIEEYGEEEIISRISNPMWFQAFSNVLGFDWHSSGSTTTTAAALKEAVNREEGIKAAGGKGKASLKTPDEIKVGSSKLGIDEDNLINSSKIIAKIDNSLIQDNYSLYHHVFFFTRKSYAVVQQGMNKEKRLARRYHWNSKMLFFNKEEHIVGFKEGRVLVITGKENENLRRIMVDIGKEYRFPSRHNIITKLDLSKRDIEFFKKLREINPSNFKEMLLIKGMGKKRLRALALLSNIIYGERLDWEDPVKYSFAHGGKDGIPYPVDKKMYDENIIFLKEALENSPNHDKVAMRILKKLNKKLKQARG